MIILAGRNQSTQIEIACAIKGCAKLSKFLYIFS